MPHLYITLLTPFRLVSFARFPRPLPTEITSLVQTNIDNIKLLSFSNAIMMETTLMACVEKLIDVVFEAVDCSSCSVFVMNDDMQSMDEVTHSVYR